jgi:hypothetical protein
MDSIHGKELDRQLICRLRDSLIDSDIVVDDLRREVDAAVGRFKTAIAHRDRIAAQLEAAINRTRPVA